MAITLDPHGAGAAHWLYAECHSPTGFACAQAAPPGTTIIALGAPGPWAQQAEAYGWTTIVADITTESGVDAAARRLMDTPLRVCLPLMAMPQGDIVVTTARLLAALGRAHARVERMVLGGSACVWRRRAHRWGVGDDAAIGPPLAPRAQAYLVAEALAGRVAQNTLVRLRAAPLWDAPERGLEKRLKRAWIPQPKAGRAVLDPLCLSDFAQATRAAMAAGEDVGGLVFGLPGPEAYQARALAEAAGTRVFHAPAGLSEAMGRFGVFGWDRDVALTLAWSLTLSGSGAQARLGWSPRHLPF